MSDFVPPSPKSISLRPLTKGMVSNASVGEDGAKVVRNLLVEPIGWRRRAAWIPAFGSKTAYGAIQDLFEGEYVQDIISFTATDGTQMYVALTNRRLLKLGATTWETIPFGASSYTLTAWEYGYVDASGATFLTDGISTGDVVDTLNFQDFTHVLVADYLSVDGLSGDIAVSDTADGMLVETGMTYGFNYAFLRLSAATDGIVVSALGDFLRIRIRIESGIAGTYRFGVWVSDDWLFYEEATLTAGVWQDVDVPLTSGMTWYSNWETPQFVAIVGGGGHTHYTIASIRLMTNASMRVVATAVTETRLSFSGYYVPTSVSSVTVEKDFTTAENDLVDWTETPGYVVFVNNSVGGIVKFDGSALTLFGAHAASGDPDADYLQGARTINYFAGRVWLGETIEADGGGHRRVRWSSLTDITEFAVIDYIDFTGEDSSILKVTSSENVPIVFMENAIYTGYASTLEGLPFAFVRVESGAVSLAGAHAFTSANGGLFFIAFDNFYFLATGREGSGQTVACTAIGTVVVNESVEKAPSFLRAQVFYDRTNEQVWFVLPTVAGRIWRIFVFSLRTKAWSYIDQPAEILVALARLPRVLEATSWTDLDATTWSAIEGTTWASLTTRISPEDLFAVDVSGVVYARNDASLNDSLVEAGTLVESAIAIEGVTGDIDFDAPDVDKVVTRVAVTIDDITNITRENDATFSLSLSETHGRTWVDKGTLTIEVGSNEDEAHFRFRSDVARIRLACEQTPPLILSDVVVRVRPGELHNVR